MTKDPAKSVVHILSGDLFGGSEAQMTLQLPALQTLGWRVTVILFNEGETAKRFRIAGVPVEICPEKSGSLALYRFVLRALRRLRPNIVVSHGYKEAIFAALCARRLRILMAMTYHGATENYGGIRSLKMFVYSFLQNLIAKNYASALVAVNASLASRLGISDDPRLSIVSNVASLQNRAEATEPTYGIDKKKEGEKWICVVGRLAPVKRFDRAIQALATLHRDKGMANVRLLIVGDGPERDRLALLLEQVSSAYSNQLQVEMLGFRDDAVGIIADSDVLMISSDSEGMPTILLEAMFSGTAVVSTRLPGVEEIQARFPDYPIVVTEFTPEGLAAGAQQLLERDATAIDSALLDQIRGQFAPSRAAADLDRLYQQMTGSSSSLPLR